MRTFLAFAIILCLAGGAWLLFLPELYWPARGDPTLALYLATPATRMLGGTLLIAAVLGVMAILQARNGHSASRNWQYGYFALAMLATTLFTCALLNGEIVPNPEASRPFSQPATPAP